MNLYFELLKKPVFSMEDVNEFYNNMDSARSAIKRLMKDGMVAKIRNNMYTCISGETGAPVANRFQIASHITPTSYVSHHTAMIFCIKMWKSQLKQVIFVKQDAGVLQEVTYLGMDIRQVRNQCGNHELDVKLLQGVLKEAGVKIQYQNLRPIARTSSRSVSY